MESLEHLQLDFDSGIAADAVSTKSTLIDMNIADRLTTAGIWNLSVVVFEAKSPKG